MISGKSGRPGDMISLGIDVGATTTRIAIVGDAGAIYDGRRVTTARLSDPTAWTHWLIREVESLFDSTEGTSGHVGGQVAVIGLALPGLIDSEAKVVQRSVNLTGLEKFPVAGVLAERFGRACYLITDAQAATWGEYQAIAPVDKPSRFVHLRFGTGIAFGWVEDGVLQQLMPGRTQHLDFLVYDKSPDARHCQCGLSGCLETIASGAALAILTNQANLGTTIGELRNAYEHNVGSAVDLVHRIRQAIEIVRVNITTQLSPSVITIGGGVVERFPALFDQLLFRKKNGPASTYSLTPDRLKEAYHSMPPAVAHSDPSRASIMPHSLSPTIPRVTMGARGDWAGSIGAGLLARTLQAQPPG